MTVRVGITPDWGKFFIQTKPVFWVKMLFQTKPVFWVIMLFQTKPVFRVKMLFQTKPVFRVKMLLIPLQLISFKKIPHPSCFPSLAIRPVHTYSRDNEKPENIFSFQMQMAVLAKLKPLNELFVSCLIKKRFCRIRIFRSFLSYQSFPSFSLFELNCFGKRRFSNLKRTR